MADMTKTDRLAFVIAAATQIPSDDNELSDAFDAAEAVIRFGEGDASKADELFLEFVSLLDAKGIVIKAPRPEFTAQEEKWLKTPRPNRGKLYG